MRVRWLGPGILLTEAKDVAVTVAFPGDTAEVSKERADLLIGKGLATPKILQRVDVGYDVDHPRPTKAERASEERSFRASREVWANVLLARRLHPHNEDVKLAPVPVGGD